MTAAASSAIKAARAEFRFWRSRVRDGADHPTRCWVCDQRHLRVEAAALALDMAVAEVLSGRRPRIWSKEVPLS